MHLALSARPRREARGSDDPATDGLKGAGQPECESTSIGETYRFLRGSTVPMLASGVSTTLIIRGGRVRMGTHLDRPPVGRFRLDAGRAAAVVAEPRDDAVDAARGLLVADEVAGERDPTVDDARPRP